MATDSASSGRRKILGINYERDGHGVFQWQDLIPFIPFQQGYSRLKQSAVTAKSFIYELDRLTATWGLAHIYAETARRAE